MILISAVILAAGTSSRMGKPKQLLPLGESTILAQTLAQVRAAHLHEIVLVLGAAAETIQTQLPLESLKVVLNSNYEQGIAGSLQAGLAALDPAAGAALIVLGDQPFVRPQTLIRIADEYRRRQPQILIPTHQGQRGNPVLLDRSIFPEARQLKGDTGFRALFENHQDTILKLEVEDPGILQDLDEPADYNRLKHL